MERSGLNRRNFLTSLTVATVPLLISCRYSTFAQDSKQDILERIKRNAVTTGDTSWSGARDAPSGVSRRTELAGPGDPGEPIFISGTVYLADGKPAPQTLIYVYHTDVEGFYGRNGEHRHGRYRGWMLTDEAGRYELRTIKPASYPNSTVASHIHMTVTRTNLKEDWVDSILFEGDRFLTAHERKVRKGGFDPVLKFVRGADGKMRSTRDIRLSV